MPQRVVESGAAVRVKGVRPFHPGREGKHQVGVGVPSGVRRHGTGLLGARGVNGNQGHVNHVRVARQREVLQQEHERRRQVAGLHGGGQRAGADPRHDVGVHHGQLRVVAGRVGGQHALAAAYSHFAGHGEPLGQLGDVGGKAGPVRQHRRHAGRLWQDGGEAGIHVARVRATRQDWQSMHAGVQRV